MKQHRLLKSIVLISLLGAWVAPASAEIPAIPAGAQQATLDLQMTWGKGDRPSRIYVAAVSEDRPWSEPTREAVLDDGSAVTWTLSPGRYRLAVGAPDFLIVYSPTIDLAPGQRHRQAIELERFAHVTGRVIGRDGQPVAGARVGRLRAFLDHFAKRLSPLGEKTLAKNFLRLTDQDGRFEIPAHPSAGELLWAEADLHSPELLHNVRSAGPDSSLGEIALAPGGALKIQWTPQADRAADDLRLQLVPADDVPLGSIRLQDARALWERSADRGTATWPSLPPGDYALWIKGPSYAAHRLVPHQVARFEIPPGKTVTRRVGLPAVEPEPDEPAASKGRANLVDAKLLLPGTHLAELDGLTVVRWSESADTGPTPVPSASIRAEETSGGTRVDLTAACAAGSVFLVESSKLFGVSKQTGVHGCKQSLRVPLSPRSTLEGRFLAPQGEQLPRRAQTLLRPCGSTSPMAQGGAGGEPTTVIPASLDEKGELSTSTPAGCFDVAVSVSRFAVTRWTEVKLPENGTGRLPVTHLLPGGAILARVVSGRDGLGLEGVRARAVQDGELAALYGAVVRTGTLPESAGATPLEGSTSPEGWVRLYGLRPGTWRLALTSKNRRYPSVSDPIALRGPEEVVVDPMELPPPASLTVHVEVGSSFDDSGAEPVSIYARGADPSEPLFQMQLDGKLDGNGTALLEEIPPGQWTILGLVRLKSGRLFPVGEETVEVPPGQDVHTTLVLDEPIFHGVVTSRSEPIAGALVLTPLPIDGRRKMTVRLHEDGTFTVPLERAGAYRGEVTSDDGKILRAVVPEVDFEDPDNKVEIALPTARIAGLVLDPEGHPASKARVEAASVPQGSGGSSQDGPPRDVRRHVRTDEDGAFVFESLSPGRWTLRATREELVSDRREIELGQNEERTGILLDLKSPSHVELLVTSQGGLPQPGVEVFATMPSSSPRSPSEAQRGVTDGHGVVVLEEPERPEAGVNLMLRGPSGLATAKRVVLRDGVSVDLSGAASELRIRVPRRKGIPGPELFLVSETGACLDPYWAGTRVPADDETTDWLVVPRVSNGRWRLVMPRSAEELFLVSAGRGLDLPGVAEATLDGSPVTLDLSDR